MLGTREERSGRSGLRIGVAGMGRMGRAIARRLMKCGHDVAVWNRTTEKAEPIIAAGAGLAPNPVGLAEAVEAVVTTLTDAAALEAVYDGRSGLAAGAGGGKLFIEMSTVRPATQRALAEKVRSAGGAYVECAVSGSVGLARQGKLIGL